ncbi:hypothetical protein CCMA1212_010117 [Trichoderma ghanense]|uniref:Uncharacterized protein n=1 Tax=Trichoderma ghanense TaxID=65468 RepID=A0ABY2GS52_9HYPO
MSPNPLAVLVRDDTDCLPGTTFYSCVANRFRGCCSTDPCALSSCPDGILWKVPSKTSSEPDKATPTPTNDGQSRQREEESTPSRPTPTSKESATMTDSGITHTIPNNSIVTITRHTTITTGRPTTTTSDTFVTSPSTTDVPLTGTPTATSEITPAPSSTDAQTTTSPSQSSAASPLSTGVIVGIAIGGAVAIAVLVVLAFALLRRRKKQQPGSETASVIQQDTGRDEVVEDKHFPQPVSAHTTGTQASSDPFAPFGGRADQPDDPYRPPSGTFEMDGTSAAPVELPAVSASSPGPGRSTHKGTRLEPVQEVTAADPRANLTSGPADDGKPVYVNHWGQYKNLG